jgi:hypothetical protein
MMDPKYLDKFNEARGCACLGVTATIKMWGYDLYFHREKSDFVHDPGFTPFFWKKKGDDPSKEGPGPDNEDMDAPSRNSSASTSRMDIDNPQSSNTTSHGKTVSGGSTDGSSRGLVTAVAVTPFSPNPVTQRAKEIVAEARLKSPELIAKVSCKSVLMSEPCVLAVDCNAVTREGQESPSELTALVSEAMVESAAGMTASRAAFSPSPGVATPAVDLLSGVSHEGVAGSPL